MVFDDDQVLADMLDALHDFALSKGTNVLDPHPLGQLLRGNRDDFGDHRELRNRSSSSLTSVLGFLSTPLSSLRGSRLFDLLLGGIGGQIEVKLLFLNLPTDLLLDRRQLLAAPSEEHLPKLLVLGLQILELCVALAIVALPDAAAAGSSSR